MKLTQLRTNGFSKKSVWENRLKFLVKCRVELFINDPVDGAACQFPLLIPVKNDTQRHLPDLLELTQLGINGFSKRKIREKPLESFSQMPS